MFDPDKQSQMDYLHLTRLKMEQQKAIESAEERIYQLKKYRNDYCALKSRLKSLPDKTRHDVMVPFGPMAFMPGELVHTNEILVLLGDNWFVDRSATQASGVVDRRLESIDSQIEGLTEQMNLLKPRLDFTIGQQQLLEGQGGVVEIREDYEEEKEQLWREQHRKNVRRYREDRKKHLPTASDSDLWARLDELQQLEVHNDEYSRLECDEAELIASDNSSDSNHNSSEEVVDYQPYTITFKHSNETEIFQQVESDSTTTDVVVQSPSDIYNRFVQSNQPKSILKPSKGPGSKTMTRRVSFTSSLPEEIIQNLESPEDHSEESNPVPESPQMSNVEAFRGTVVERNLDKNKPPVPLQSAPPPRISKFKAQRLGSKMSEHSQD